MTNLFKAWLAYQTAVVDGWTGMWRLGLCSWERYAALQMELLNGGAPPRRQGDRCPSGASFTDGYGRRVHDIDPERDV